MRRPSPSTASVCAQHDASADACGPFQIVKADTERRLVTAWLNHVTTEDGSPVIDSEGDVIPIDEMEDAVNTFVATGGLGRAERSHRDFGLGDMVQIFTLSSAEREALGFGPGPEGTIVKLRITDDRLWEQVKSGEYNSLSFTGTSLRTTAA